MENELIEAIEKYENAVNAKKFDDTLDSYRNLMNVKNKIKQKGLTENKDININVNFKTNSEVDIDTIIKTLEEKLIKNMPTIHIKQ